MKILLAAALLTAPVEDTAGLRERCLLEAKQGQVEACEAAIRQDANDIEVNMAYGDALFYRADYHGALTVFRKIAALRPDDARVQYRYGAALGSLRRWPEAIEPLQRAVRLDHRYREAQETLAISYRMLGRQVEAFAANRNAADLGSVTAIAGVAYDYEHGRGVPADPGRALSWLHRAAEHGHIGAMDRLVDIYAKGGLGMPANRYRAALWRKRVEAARP